MRNVPSISDMCHYTPGRCCAQAAGTGGVRFNPGKWTLAKVQWQFVSLRWLCLSGRAQSLDLFATFARVGPQTESHPDRCWRRASPGQMVGSKTIHLSRLETGQLTGAPRASLCYTDPCVIICACYYSAPSFRVERSGIEESPACGGRDFSTPLRCASFRSK